MLIDTHAHLDLIEPDGDLDAVLQRAREAGVTKMVTIGGNPQANQRAVDLAQQYPEVYAAVGYDRDQAIKNPSLAELEELVTHPKVVAVGEVGLDYFYHPDTAPQQQALMASMLELARKHRLPVAVHCRDAEADVLRLLHAHADARPAPPPASPGVLHCFTGTEGFATELLTLGFFISFSGIVTFRNADRLRQIAKSLPEQCLLVETDTPFLTPVPLRGQRNEPALVTHTAACVAELRSCAVAELAAITTQNAGKLFQRMGL